MKEKMPSKVVAYVLVVTTVGAEHKAIEEIKVIEGVVLAQTVYGEFDVICRVESDNLKDLDDSITKVRKIKNILRTMTLISG